MRLFVRVSNQTRLSWFFCLAAVMSLIVLIATVGCNPLPTDPRSPAVNAKNINSSGGIKKIDPGSSQMPGSVVPAIMPAPESTSPTNLNSRRSTIPRDTITLLFRKEDAKDPSRLDSTSRAATAALERELLQRRYKIPPTSPDLLKKLDRSPDVVVCFAPDAGFSMTYSVYKNLRPDPGVNTYAAEVAIRARVFVGANVLSVEEGRGTVRFSGTGQLYEYGERRAMERAAERAAVSLVNRVDARLKNLSSEQIAEYAYLESPQGGYPDNAVMPPPSGVPPLTPPAEVHGLIIGVSDYSHTSLASGSFPELKGVAEDVRNIEHTFVADLGIAPNRIKVLKNQDATAARVRAEIASMAQAAGPNDLLVIYIAGHGQQANFKRVGMSMPILYDYSSKNQESAPDFFELLARVTQSAANRFVMIVDTCHAGGAVSVLTTVVFTSRGVQLSNASGAPSPQMVLSELDWTRNIAVLASARFEEFALERSGGGLFTYYLAKGLKEARKEEVLRDIVEKRVAEPVIRESRQLCSPAVCPTGQQTPTLGFTGGGDMIRF